jgi:hypothetical protein
LALPLTPRALGLDAYFFFAPPVESLQVERFAPLREAIYEPERPIPRTEAVKSLESAEQFVQGIIQRIEKLNPQKRLIP